MSRQIVESKDAAIISVDAISKAYERKKRRVVALDNVSLEIHQGEFVAIVGESGSGKSTLLQLIGGLDRSDSGSINIHGVNPSVLSDSVLSEFRNRTIGFVFQFFYLQPFLNLVQNIELASMPRRAGRAERTGLAIAIAERMGLGERLGHFPSELSGGQIQRVAIARALLNQPLVVLADEPTGNLDPKNSQEILELLKSYCRESNATIVIATHDYSIAAQADRVVTLKEGRLA